MLSDLLSISQRYTIAPLARQTFAVAKPIPEAPADIIIFLFFNWVPLEKNIFWLYLVILGVAGFVSHSLIIYAIQLSNLSFVTNFQ